MANKYLDYNGLDYFWDKIDNKKQNKLTAGSNITISGSTISASQPTVNNGRLTIQKNGSNVQTFTANQSTNVTANIVVPTKTSDLTNDSGFALDSDVVHKTGAETITGEKTFSATKVKVLNGETVFNYSAERRWGALSAGAGYVNWEEAKKNGAWHRIWRISFPANTDFWGRLTIGLTASYASFNASGYMEKQISIAFNGANLYNNVGHYSALSINTEKDFRISECIWNADTSQWQIIIYSQQPQGNNAPRSVILKCETYTDALLTAFDGITIESTPEISQIASYRNTKATPSGEAKTFYFADLPVYQDPYGREILNTDSVASATKLGGIKVGSGLTISNGVLSTQTTAPDWSDITNKPTFATVATSGSYNDLSNKPTIPAAQVQSNWTQTTTTAVDYIKNKPTFATVATSGSYNDLSNKPTIPTVNNATLTIQKNGSTVKTFTANASSNVTANITVPTKTSDITNDSNFITDANAQKFAIGQGSTQPVFDDMTPIQTIEWDVSDTTYRPIYQFENTGWTYTNMDITVAYRVTVTGTNINSVTDVVDRWFNPTSWPLTSALMKTQSTSAATTGLRYLRAVYPTSGYLNKNTYKFGMELEMYNTTARHVKVEVFKTNSVVTWNSTKPSGSIYQGNSTYQSINSIEAYATRGWKFRQPVQMYANSASNAGYSTDFEPVSLSASELKAGATALTGGHYAYLADDGLIYDISDTTHNIALGESRIGWLSGNINANATIWYGTWRAISRPNATQLGYFNHDTFVLGDRVYLRCTMDSNGNVHSDNYLSKTMSAGYTWMPMGWARTATTLYVDTRFPMFYTLDSSGKLTHINGKQINAGSTITVDSALSSTSTNPVQNKVINTALNGKQHTLTAGSHINITNNVIKAKDYVHSESPVTTGSITPVVTNGMVANGTLTASKFASGELLKLTMSTTDIGEGAALAANTLYGVYD